MLLPLPSPSEAEDEHREPGVASQGVYDGDPVGTKSVAKIPQLYFLAV
jgi:hypothetical protein